MNIETELNYVLETNNKAQAMSIILEEGDSYISEDSKSKMIITRKEDGTFSLNITKENFKDNRLTKPELKAIREYLKNFNRDGDVLPKITEDGITLDLNKETDMTFDMDYVIELDEDVTYKTMAYAKMIGYSIVNILKDHVMVLNHQDNENKEAWFKVF